MTFSILLSMFALSLAMSISPGPVNMLVISSGINYGVKKTMPFVSGATIGFTLLLICVAFGFITVLDRFPSVLSIIEIAGYTFIIYMGYKIASSSAELSIDEKEMNTLKFHEGFLLQWLNPKAWIACVSGISMFSSIENSIPFFVIIYFFVCYASLTFWAILGDKATLFFNTNKRLKVLNITMGSLLVLPALYLLFEQYIVV